MFMQPTGFLPRRQPQHVRYQSELKVYPSSFCFRQDIDIGDKILLPSSALNTLMPLMSRGNKDPMTFCLVNLNLPSPKKTYCGVLQFVAEEGTCYVPSWMFKMLMFLQPGSPCHISLVPDLKKKNAKKPHFIKLRPHQTKFIDLDNPKAVLQYQLRNFTCLHEGDTIQITTFSGKFDIDIMQIKPKNQYQAICIIDMDVQVDFAPPLDYEEPQYNQNRDTGKFVQEKQSVGGIFGGKGVRIDQKTNKAPNNRKGSQAVQDNQYDPRKHRIHRGVRKTSNDFQGFGTKIGYAVGTKKR